jgi:hypothetical protein
MNIRILNALDNGSFYEGDQVGNLGLVDSHAENRFPLKVGNAQWMLVSLVRQH